MSISLEIWYYKWDRKGYRRNAVVSGIILASGFSRRMGKNKLLLKMKKMTVIEKVVSNALNSSLDEIILVTQYDEVLDIFKNTAIKTIKNRNPELGLSNSIVEGVKASAQFTDGYLVILGDMPLITNDHINFLINEFALNQNYIIVPTFQGKQKNPVLFPSFFKKDLINLKGDKGGKEILSNNKELIRYVEFITGAVFKDIDVEADYKEVRDDE